MEYDVKANVSDTKVVGRVAGRGCIGRMDQRANEGRAEGARRIREVSRQRTVQ